MHVIPTAPLLLLAVVAAGCGDDGAVARDAGWDAGRDAGWDAGRDAGRRRDAGWDAGGPRDAGRDASGWYDVAEWERLPEVPEPCVIERARHPELLYTHEWTSCGDGCERLVEDPRYQQAFDPDGTWHDGERGYFWVVARALEDPIGRRMVLLVTTDGEALGAWRGPAATRPGVCTVGPTAVGDGWAAFTVDVYFDSWSGFLVYHAPLAEISAETTAFGRLDSPALGSVLTSSTTVAVELQPTGVVQVFEEGRNVRLGRTPEIPGGAQQPQLVDDHVFFSEYTTPWRAVHGSIDQPAAVFYEVPSVDVRLFQTDGISFAWLQAYDRGTDGAYARVELWTAPYTTDPAALEPRLVREMDGYTQMTIGGGLIGLRRISTPPQRIELYSLTDGTQSTFVAPEGTAIRRIPMYITDTEMLLSAGYEGETTLLRVQLDAVPVTD